MRCKKLGGKHLGEKIPIEGKTGYKKLGNKHLVGKRFRGEWTTGSFYFQNALQRAHNYKSFSIFAKKVKVFFSITVGHGLIIDIDEFLDVLPIPQINYHIK